MARGDLLVVLGASFAVRARMCIIISAGQMLKIKMRVHLRGGNAGVAEQLLHRTQVAAGLEHVGGEGVAQQMWMDASIEPAASAPVVESRLDRAACEPGAAAADEHG